MLVLGVAGPAVSASMCFTAQYGIIYGIRRPGHALAHLDVAHGVESVQLVEQLKHGALDLALAAAVRVVALGADGVDLIWRKRDYGSQGSGSDAVQRA